MDFGAATHPGYVRSTNEDGYFASREQAVFAVADGMGGHEKGEVASRLALEAIVQHADAIAHATPSELPTNLHQALQDANAAIISHPESQDARARMGTTVVLATICGDRLYFAHIGDSRLYLLRGDMLIQLTRDHSLVQALVDRGEITPEEAAIHPLRHQITRVVGADDVVTPEIASQNLEPGDVVLLCTDGLSGAVAQEQMKAILAAPGLTAQQRADALVRSALDAGGPDNITSVVVCYQRPHSVAHRHAQWHLKPPHLPFWQSLLLSLLALLVLAAAVVSWEYTHPQYYVAPDAHGVLTLYRDWPILPMLDKQHLSVPGVAPITYEDTKAYLSKYTDPRLVRVDGREVGEAFLKDKAKAVVSGLLEKTKVAVEKHDVILANSCLKRARDLGADQAELDQLALQIKKILDTQAQHTVKPTTPTPAPKAK